MCQLTPSKICQLTPTIPYSEKPVIDTDSVNFSIRSVRLKLGTIFPREMLIFPGCQTLSPLLSHWGRITQIFSGTTRNSHISEEILLAGNHRVIFFRGGGGGNYISGGKSAIQWFSYTRNIHFPGENSSNGKSQPFFLFFFFFFFRWERG